MDAAATHGFLDIVKYLNEKMNAPFSSSAMIGAVQNGHLDVVRYLHEHVHSDYNGVIEYATENGHGEIAKYLTFASNPPIGYEPHL